MLDLIDLIDEKRDPSNDEAAAAAATAAGKPAARTDTVRHL